MLNRWLTEINKFLVPNQITKGGKIILNQLDNEYSSNTDPGYLKMIKNKFIADGMEVPDIYNDANMLQNFPNGPADIYGWDNYPAGFDCSAPDAWPNNRSTEYMSYHAKTNDHQPAALWEFQGGAFDPWGGPGYEGTTYINFRLSDTFTDKSVLLILLLLLYSVLSNGKRKICQSLLQEQLCTRNHNTKFVYDIWG